MKAHLKPDDSIIVQLGIGNHIDHVTVRQAAELLGRHSFMMPIFHIFFTIWSKFR